MPLVLIYAKGREGTAKEVRAQGKLKTSTKGIGNVGHSYPQS
jgi:hypothetical protein